MKMTDPISNDLLPCPFCGGKPTGISVRINDDGVFYDVFCRTRGCRGSDDVGLDPQGMGNAISAWNRRQSPEAGVRLVWKQNSAISLWTGELALGAYYVAYDEGDGWRVFRYQFAPVGSEVEVAFGPKASALADAKADFERLTAPKEPEGVEPTGFVSATTLAYLKKGDTGIDCSIYGAPVSIHDQPLYTSPPPKAVTINDEMVERAAESLRDGIYVCPDDMGALREMSRAALTAALSTLSLASTTAHEQDRTMRGGMDCSYPDCGCDFDAKCSDAPEALASKGVE